MKMAQLSISIRVEGLGDALRRIFIAVPGLLSRRPEAILQDGAVDEP